MKKFLRFCLAIFAIALALTAILVAVVYLYLSSTAYSRSPVDANRFNTNRQHLSKDLPIDEIAPLQIGEFTRTDLTDGNTNLNYERTIRATYANSNGQQVDLSAYLDTTHTDDEAFLSIVLSCGDCGANPPVVNTDANISYGYDFCGCWFFTDHQFRWINGDWKFRASAASTRGGSTGETLLTFLSSYPF